MGRKNRGKRKRSGGPVTAPVAEPGAAAPPGRPVSRARRLLTRPVNWVAGFVGATLLAAGVAAATKTGDRLADRVLPAPSASAARPPYPFGLAVTPGFDAGMSYALPAVVAGGAEAQALLAGFTGDDELAVHLHTRGGAPIATVRPSFAFTGRVAGATRILKLRVFDKRASKVLAGTRLDTRLDGELPTVAVTVDLDHPGAEVLGKDGKPYFAGHNIDLVEGEHLTVFATFSAARRSYQWIMAVDYLLPDGAAATAYVDNTGGLHRTAAEITQEKRFSLTGPAPRYGARWQTGNMVDGFRVQ